MKRKQLVSAIEWIIKAASNTTNKHFWTADPTTTMIRTSLFLMAAFLLAATAPTTLGFCLLPKNTGNHVISSSSLQMGLFDGLKKAFANEEFATPPQGIRASARHILVKTPEEVEVVMEQLGDSSNFATVAKEFSTCPSAAQGGSLGSFTPGTMVKEFDRVIFDPNTELGQVVGPVETKFGYHVIMVEQRTGV